MFLTWNHLHMVPVTLSAEEEHQLCHYNAAQLLSCLPVGEALEQKASAHSIVTSGRNYWAVSAFIREPSSLQNSLKVGFCSRAIRATAFTARHPQSSSQQPLVLHADSGLQTALRSQVSGTGSLAPLSNCLPASKVTPDLLNMLFACA